MDRPLALVTGASRGIGAAIARALAAAGSDLVLTARSREALENTAAAAQESDAAASASCIAADLTDPTAPDRLLAAAPRPLDLIVNNAGTAPSERLASTRDEDLSEAWALHVAAPFRLLRAALPSMADRGGCAIQIASTAGLRGYPFTSAYTAAKHGMVGLTRAVAAEFARTPLGIYALCPGFVETEITRGAAEALAAKGRSTADEALARMGEMNAIGRMHTAQEVADAVVGLWRDRPKGCVYLLDRDPPGFVD